MLQQSVVKREAKLWPQKSKDRHKKISRDVKDLFLGIWVSLKNRLLKQLEGKLHLKGVGKGAQPWSPAQLEDELSRKEGWRCYGPAFGPRYCRHLATIAEPFLSPQVRLFLEIKKNLTS
jgi:hypothetical protein